jgi:hypothetical protein
MAGNRAGHLTHSGGHVKRLTLGALILLSTSASAAYAQAPAAPPAPPPVNSGAIKLTAGLDVPSVYYFRGIRQEVNPKLTLWPYGDVGITLASADKGLKSVAVNFGVWNSLHTGSSGSKTFGKSMHYEEDFYGTLTLGWSAASLATMYKAYTSPNQSYNTVKEIDFTLTGTHKYAPYVIVAQELNQTKGTFIVGADAGQKRGSYMELGVTPTWSMGPTAYSIPLSAGFSLKNYYEANGKDISKFGFFDAGGMITETFSGIPAKFGSWNVHGRVDYLRLSNGTMAVGVGTGTSKNKYVVLGGIGLSY